MNLDKELDDVEKEIKTFYKVLDNDLRYGTTDEREDVMVLLRRLRDYRGVLEARKIARNLM